VELVDWLAFSRKRVIMLSIGAGSERMDFARWYNAAPSERLSCRQLDRAASEFECQGLELDFPVVCWGDDLIWIDVWRSSGKRSGVRDPHRLRLNTYRVLLSRGRDGMILYVRKAGILASMFEALITSGAQLLTQ
jgi:DUF2075 family protein